MSLGLFPIRAKFGIFSQIIWLIASIELSSGKIKEEEEERIMIIDTVAFVVFVLLCMESNLKPPIDEACVLPLSLFLSPAETLYRISMRQDFLVSSPIGEIWLCFQRISLTAGTTCLKDRALSFPAGTHRRTCSSPPVSIVHLLICTSFFSPISSPSILICRSKQPIIKED